MITYNDKHLPEGYLPHTLPSFKKLNILRINELFEYKILIFIYDCFHDLLPIQFQSMFTLSTDIHQHSTRSNLVIVSDQYQQEITCNNLFIPYARTSNYGQKSIEVVGPKKWNTVPYNIKMAMSRNSFKKSLKKQLISQYNQVD